MATSIATATTKKKKLVYQQDPDGVFRLKKVSPDSSSEVKSVNSDAKPDKKAVDEYLNDLVVCSYRIKELNNEEKDEIKEDSISPTNPSVDKNESYINPSTTKLPNRESIPKQQQPFEKKKKTKIKVIAKPTLISKVVKLLTTSPSESMQQFHLQSFISGLVAAFVLHRLQPLLSYYAVVLFNILKVGLVWAVVIGGICWYLGLIKTQDTAVLYDVIDKIKARITGTENLENFEPEDESGEEDEEEPQEDPDAEPVPTNMEEQIYLKHEKPKHVEKSRSGSPIRPERRNTLTRVTPFKHTPPTKPELKYRSTSDLPSQKKAAPPKLSRLHTTDLRNYHRRNTALMMDKNRRHSNTSLDLAKSKTNGTSGSVHSDESASPKTAPNKQLPPDPSDIQELPFINEVKLMSSEEMGKAGSPVDSFENVKRSLSVFSKKSVLGTGANYNKFVANVQGMED